MPGQRDRHAGCVGAHLVENDLFDFLLFSLPDNDTYSHRAGPTSQADVDRRGRPRARPADARRRRPGRVPGRARGDRDVRPLAEPRRDARSTWPTRSTDWRVLLPSDPEPEEAEIAVCPGARARRRSTCSTRRGATAGRASWPTTCADVDGRRPGGPARERRRRGAGARAASCASGPGGDLTDARGQRLDRGGRLAALDLAVDDGAVRSGDYPDALRPAVVGARVPAHGRRAGVGRAGLRVRRLGRRRPRGRAAATARCTACDSLGVLLTCGIGPADAGEREQWAIEDVTPHGAGPLRGTSCRMPSRARLRTHACVRAGMRRQPQLGPAGEVLRGRRIGLRGEPGRVHPRGRGRRASPSGGGDRWRSWWP